MNAMSVIEDLNIYLNITYEWLDLITQVAVNYSLTQDYTRSYKDLGSFMNAMSVIEDLNIYLNITYEWLDLITQVAVNYSWK